MVLISSGSCSIQSRRRWLSPGRYCCSVRFSLVFPPPAAISFLGRSVPEQRTRCRCVCVSVRIDNPLVLGLAATFVLSPVCCSFSFRSRSVFPLLTPLFLFRSVVNTFLSVLFARSHFSRCTLLATTTKILHKHTHTHSRARCS